MAGDNEIEDASDIITTAINNPVGIITEAVIGRFAQCKLETGSGIPEKEHLAILNRLMTDDHKFLLGRVIIASRLQYFFAIDPDWTKQKLLPEFDWETSSEAKYMWQGYLWQPRITADLALEIRNLLKQALENSAELDKHSDSLYQIFVVICIEYPDLYSTEEQRQIMISIGVNGLTDISDFLWRSVSGEKESRDDYWRNRIKPFIEKAWPKIGALVHPDISNNFAVMSIQLDESFPDALKVIKSFLMPMDELNFFLHQLENKTLLTEQPLAIFELLSLVFSDNYQWPDKSLRDIINRLSVEVPEIKKQPKYVEIEEFLIKNGF